MDNNWFLKLRGWEVSRHIAQDHITPIDRELNPFVGIVFKITRGKCKGLLFLINAVTMDQTGTIQNIDWTNLNFDLTELKMRGIFDKSLMDDAVARAVKDIVRVSIKNAKKKGLIVHAEDRSDNSKESHS